MIKKIIFRFIAFAMYLFIIMYEKITRYWSRALYHAKNDEQEEQDVIYKINPEFKTGINELSFIGSLSEEEVRKCCIVQAVRLLRNKKIEEYKNIDFNIKAIDLLKIVKDNGMIGDNLYYLTFKGFDNEELKLLVGVVNTMIENYIPPIR